MTLEWKRAGLKDLEALTQTRLVVLRAANELDENADLSAVGRAVEAYYRERLVGGEHIAYLVYDRTRVVGTGGASFYHVLPTYCNPNSRRAYIMNMYTHPEYRRQGIARRTLDLLIRDIRAQGVQKITLEATPMGRPLYRAYGFIDMPDEMELPVAGQGHETQI